MIVLIGDGVTWIRRTRELGMLLDQLLEEHNLVVYGLMETPSKIDRLPLEEKEGKRHNFGSSSDYRSNWFLNDSSSDFGCHHA